MPLKIIISLQLVRDRLHAQIHNGNKTTIFEVYTISLYKPFITLGLVEFWGNNFMIKYVDKSIPPYNDQST